MNVAEKVELGWKALHMQPGVPDKRHRKELCQCEPEPEPEPENHQWRARFAPPPDKIPCEYCALYEALKAAERILVENLGLKLTLTDERSLYADLAEKNERLKAKCEQADILGTAWQEDLRKMERQAAVVEAARGMVKLSEDG
jgi:hypothetical protein